jgi:hypothetical protein
MKLPRVFAFYLPQYHPVPENDKFWGAGFTEWTNVAKARPLFPGHIQPKLPGELGFYDLRLSETREAQAEMASEHCIEGFIYYHYWFAGRQILDRPLREVVQTGKPDFPFAICWANQSWSGIWHGAPNRILIEQTYPGYDDHVRHFYELLPAFSDKRYILVDGKPLFLLFQPTEIPDLRNFINLWNELAVKNGLAGFYFVAFAWNWEWDHLAYGVDAILPQLPLSTKRAPGKDGPAIYQYEAIYRYCVPDSDNQLERYPCLVPNWDNTPRAGRNGVVFLGSSPELFQKLLRLAFEYSLSLDRPLVFIKAWNEWAEGNYLEPDLRHGREFLLQIRSEISRLLSSP